MASTIDITGRYSADWIPAALTSLVKHGSVTLATGDQALVYRNSGLPTWQKEIELTQLAAGMERKGEVK